MRMARTIAAATVGTSLDPETNHCATDDDEDIDVGNVVYVFEGSATPDDVDGTDDPLATVEARRELSRHLRSSAFPADRDELLAEAADQHAPEAVTSVLRRLPVGVRYGTVHEVWSALHGADDVRGDAATDPLSDAGR